MYTTDHAKADHKRGMDDEEMIHHLAVGHGVDYADSGLARSTMNREHNLLHSFDIPEPERPEDDLPAYTLFRDRR